MLKDLFCRSHATAISEFLGFSLIFFCGVDFYSCNLNLNVEREALVWLLLQISTGGITTVFS